MKIRFDIVFIGMALLLLAACAKQPVEQTPPEVGATIHYRATVSEGTATRATVDGTGQYIFQTGDILYLEGTKMYGSLTLRSGADETSAVFEGDLICDEGYYPADDTPLSATLVSEAAVNCGFYSFDSNGKLQGPFYPSDQYASTFADAVSKYSVFTVDGTYGDATFILSQHSTFLVFAVRCDKGKVGVGDPVTVSLYNNGAAAPIRSADVQAEDFGAYSRTSFVTALPGGTTLSGASLSLKWGNGTDDHKEFTDITDASLLANKYYNITRDAVVPYPGFRIRATENTTLITFRFTKATGGTQYSKENGADGTWVDYTGGTIKLDKDEELCVRATRTSYQNIADDYNGNNKWYTIQNYPLMTADKKVYIAGNIMSLIVNGLESGALTEDFAFAGAFAKNGDTITIDIDRDDPLILPATTLTKCCYTRMFFRCTQLTTAPALPATTLADFCYYNMFRQCSALSDVSLLELPATELRPSCYRELFRLCTSLTEVPKNLLPVTTLQEGCYQQMFQACSKITQVPDLPAETLVKDCYKEMFRGCSVLKNIKCLATSGINSNNSTTNWVAEIGGNGTFTKKNGATWPNGNSGIPNGWTPKNVD